MHCAAWPVPEEVLTSCDPPSEDQRGLDALEFASAVLGAIRKKKSEEQRPLKTRVSLAGILAPPAQLALLGRRGAGSPGGGTHRRSSGPWPTRSGSGRSRPTPPAQDARA